MSNDEPAGAPGRADPGDAPVFETNLRSLPLLARGGERDHTTVCESSPCA